MKNKTLPSLLLVCASLACVNMAHADEAISPIPQVADEWRFSVSPYAWLPWVNTTSSAGDAGSKNVDLSLNNIISNIKSGVMIAGEAHYGRWGVTADFANAVVSKSSGFNYKGDPAYKFGDKGILQASLLNFMGSYTAFNSQDTYVDALLGVRWISLTTTIDLNLVGTPLKVSYGSPASATYGVVGVNSRYRIMNSNWYVPLYADAGTAGGPNHFTWQASTGVGVALSKMVDVSFTYRAIGFDIKTGDSNSTLIKGLFHGPQVMATFNF